MRGASRPRRVFVDTAAYFALADLHDANHTTARAVAQWLTAQRVPQFTTNFVLAETHGLILNRLRRALGARFPAGIERSSTVVGRVRDSEERRAHGIIDTYVDKDFSLIDALSFSVMERLGITHAFSFDRHFAQFGFFLLDQVS